MLEKNIRIAVEGKLPFKAIVYGGPFANFEIMNERRLAGVKMAIEINTPCDVSIPTADFYIPNKAAFNAGMIQAVKLMREGKDLYVGCMGGIGRTGLFMAVLVKAMNEVNCVDDDDPIRRVRYYYNEHAVETPAQIKFVRDFDVSDINYYLSGEYLLDAIKDDEEEAKVPASWLKKKAQSFIDSYL